jgi:transposase-like protein
MHPKLYLANSRPTQVPQLNIESTLDQIAREGARRMLIEALSLEVADYIEGHRHVRDDDDRALVVRNGKARPRSVTLGCGTVEVEAPRVRDRRPGKSFRSGILPPYLRKSPKVENLLPILYLKGLSTGDFRSALEGLLGEEATAGLSASAITALKRSWEREHAEWRKRTITGRFAYVYADGIHMSIRLGEDRKLCLLVLIGVHENGQKQLLAVEGGFRESKDSWKALLSDLVARGFTAPKLAIGDGALGFWAALRECGGFETTRAQRCWVHKMANVLNDLPKRLQPRAKSLLREMMMAETLSDAVHAKKRFADEFHAKYPKAVARIERDWPELTQFFSFPAKHWQSIRTTNAIESTFATVRLRTNVTKGAGSIAAATSMAFKLLQDAERTWRRLRGFEDLPAVLDGASFQNGVMVARAPSSTVEHRDEAIPA